MEIKTRVPYAIASNKNAAKICKAASALFIIAALSNLWEERSWQRRARHILVSSETVCKDLKTQIDGGEDFAKIAGNHRYAHREQREAIWGRFRRGRWYRNSIESFSGPKWAKSTVR